MTWLELVAAGGAGALAGWVAHALLRRTVAGRSTAATRTSSLEAHGVDSSPPPPASTSRAGGPPAAVRRHISEGASSAGVVIRHLYTLGRISPTTAARLESTQRGMVERLGLPQGSVAKILSRLGAAGIVHVERRHIAGEPRRMKAYQLTQLGESVARELRKKPPAPASMGQVPVPDRPKTG